MQLEILILSQKDKDKYHMISLISGIWDMAQMNLSTEKKIMDWENWLVAAWGEREEVGRDWELGIIGYNLEWIYKEILLSSIENYV